MSARSRAAHSRHLFSPIPLLAIAFFLGTFTRQAAAQYMYLDTNGDGVHTTADVLSPGPTTVAVWVRTNLNRDGSPGLCASDDGELTLRSYEIVLHAEGGTVGWSAFHNEVGTFGTGSVEISDSTEYRNGFAGLDLPPGTYRLATLLVSVTSGAPSIEIVPATSLDPTFHTSFGSECSGTAYDHLLRLGTDFADVDGAPWANIAPGPVSMAQPHNMPLAEGQTADQILTATDQDALPLVFSLESGPTFASIVTGSIHLAPGYSDAGSWIAAVRASDGVSSDTKTFLITVANQDRAPVMAQPPDMMVGEGTVHDQLLTASDPDGDTVTFEKVAGPDYMTVIDVDPAYGAGMVTLTPGYFDAGMTQGQVAASDGTLRDVKSFSIMIRDVDRPPAITLPGSPSVPEGSVLRFRVTAVDPDGDMVILTASSLPSGATFRDEGTGTGDFEWVPGFDQAGSYDVEFTATGMPGASASASLTITVLDLTQAIALAQPLDMALPQGTVANQVLRAMDAGGDPLQFALVSGPAYLTVTTTSAGAGLAEGNVHAAPGTSDVGVAAATVAVTDGALRDEKSFTIAVSDVGPVSDRTPFAPPFSSVGTGMTPHTVALFDIDRDGELDLLTANLGSNTISVMRGKGDGTFLAPMIYTTASKPHTVTAADLNGDGWLDLAISQIGANSIGVMLGARDGTFGPRTDIALAGSPVIVGVSDLNQDGFLDLAATDQTNGAVAVLLGHGDGTFAPPVEYPAGSKAHGLAIADLNRDGRPDVVAANEGDATVSVLLGAGGGVLAPKLTFSTRAAHTVSCGDLNADGVPDMAVANFDSGTVSVLLGRGDGTFQALPDLVPGAGPHSAVIRDVDGDGHADLITANQVANTVSFYMGHGDGTFEPKVDFSNGLGAHSIAFGDLNHDGALDVAVSNIVSNTVTLFLNRKPPRPTLPARAFLSDRSKTIPLMGQDKPFFAVQIEPIAGGFAVSDIDPAGVWMGFPGSGSQDSIPAHPEKRWVAADKDGNGIPELAVSFASADLRRILVGLSPGPHSISAVVAGRLAGGGTFDAPLTLRVVARGGKPGVTLAPNPSNPEALLSFTTSERGFARVRIFDPGGRLVATLMDAPDLAAGTHQVRIGGGALPGRALSSGVYFYRLETPGGTTSGRFVVLK